MSSQGLPDQCGASVAHKLKSQRTPFRPILNINTATRKPYTMISQLKQKKYQNITNSPLRSNFCRVEFFSKALPNAAAPASPTELPDQCGASVAHKLKSQCTPFRPILNINTATHKPYTMISQLKQKKNQNSTNLLPPKV